MKTNMRTKTKMLTMAEDGWPVEQIENSPFTNFLRRLIHGKYKVCAECWHGSRAKVNPGVGVLTPSPTE